MKGVTAKTHGIGVSVEHKYREEYSNADKGLFIFSYHITIENTTQETIQLISRHWYIADSIGVTREVKGDGVVGEQPILEPGQVHSYESACDLRSELGEMHGTYRMKSLTTGRTFIVNIPTFKMAVPYKLN